LTMLSSLGLPASPRRRADGGHRARESESEKESDGGLRQVSHFVEV